MSDEMIECPKCEYCHEPAGNHEDDCGRRTCRGCGFEFLVEVEYEPIYYTSCIAHEMGNVRDGRYRICKYCGVVMPEPHNG